MSDCNCGHPLCTDCDPTAGQVWCGHVGCMKYVVEEVGCKHQIDRAIEHSERMIKSHQEKLARLKAKAT